jgi:hypothetical protein
MICNECETVAHCSKHGCIPKQPEYKGAIEVSVIFHEGQRMFAVPKQPAQQEPVAILNHAHGIHTVRSVKLNGLPDGEYNLYTSPPAQRTWVGLTEEERNVINRHNVYVSDIISATEAKLRSKNEDRN